MAAKRRANGEGCVDYIASRDRWRARFYITVDGVKKQKTIYRKTKSAAIKDRLC